MQTELFLKRLRQARRAVNLRQTEVGLVLGRDQTFISKLESGERKTDFILLEHLAQIYKKPVSFFETLAELEQSHPGRAYLSPVQTATLPDHWFGRRTV
jgi:transcriptional regulator with XRE-family HTH domain